MPDELSAHLAFLNALIHTYTITLFLTDIYHSKAVQHSKSPVLGFLGTQYIDKIHDENLIIHRLPYRILNYTKATFTVYRSIMFDLLTYYQLLIGRLHVGRKGYSNAYYSKDYNILLIF
jgi:hypothetical protein